MIKHTFLAFLVGFFALPAIALPTTAQAAVHEDIAIKVNGMVCDFCAQSVWKVLEEYDGVVKVDIDLDTGIVTVHMAAGQTLTEDELNKAITYAGYDLVGIERIVSDKHHPSKEEPAA